MKKLTLLLALAALLPAGCHKNEEFTTHTLGGEQCYRLTFPEQMGPWGKTVGMKITYSVAWPDKGTVAAAAGRELQYLCFGDSTAADVDAAIQGWLAKSFFYEDEEGCVKIPVDELVDEGEYCMVDLNGTCDEDSVLATFIVKTESYFAGAAHGMHSVDFLTIDKATGNAVHLADLVTDTNLLCEAVAHAIQDLEANKDVRECLFDEFVDVDRMPLPRNFFIDSARNGISVFYGLYEITPYACGIQEVVLPIFWLSKHVPLTPYARRLFGPGCSIE